jgi:hypothetical protein
MGGVSAVLFNIFAPIGKTKIIVYNEGLEL